MVLVKNQILASELAPARRTTFASVFALFYQPKLAYSLAVLLFVFVGFFAYNNINVSGPKPQVVVKSNVHDLKLTSQGLASAVLGRQKDEIAVAVREVNKATQSLTQVIVENPGLAKDIALEVKNNKIYLDILGEKDIKPATDMLYKTIDQQMIEDLKKTTLTESQQKALAQINELYDKEKYSEALEKILLIK